MRQQGHFSHYLKNPAFYNPPTATGSIKVIIFVLSRSQEDQDEPVNNRSAPNLTGNYCH